jgi:uncharacterized lipoprotein YddW (UPF0748 family)
MSLEKEINQPKFRNEKQKAIINIIYTYNWVTEHMRHYLESEDLTQQQYNILRILRGSAPQPLSTLQIRERMLDKMSDTSRIVDRLVLKGLVSKKPSKADKRLVDVMISEKGKKLLAKLDQKNVQMDNILRALNDKELTTLNKLLDKLRAVPMVIFLMFIGLLGFTQSAPKYEFRAAWIATVDNIDWPSKKGLSPEVQRQEFIRLIDMHKRNGMNALIVQIRPATDAFYPSPYEPWSEWLTGTQGLPPSPYYDPLEFMITETHKRNMEFHAWCNPYRANYLIGKSSIAPNHVTKIHPEWFLTYGKAKYFDPGNKEAQAFVTEVIRDIVKRYPVDGVHFDDYFYPYRITGLEFPDATSYKKYGEGMDRADWRRGNVDSIILRLSNVIKETRPGCKFGISPFGVWRNSDKDPRGSNTKALQTNYDDLYADVLLWLKEGWIDYVAPQLYWEFGHKAAPYEVLLDWWSKNTYGKHCYIGLGMHRAGSNTIWRDSTLIPRQIEALRQTPNIQGAIFFSSKSFIRNPNGWSDSLRLTYYAVPAAVPPMDWLK